MLYFGRILTPRWNPSLQWFSVYLNKCHIYFEEVVKNLNGYAKKEDVKLNKKNVNIYPSRKDLTSSCQSE